MQTKIQSSKPRKVKEEKVKEEFIDLQKLPAYVRTWETKNTIKVYGYDVHIPDEPEDSACVNYGESLWNQIFKRTLIPNDLQYWETDKKEAFIEREYQRRKEGLWYFINGKKYYIPGLCYYFLIYWTLQTGKKPIFRMTDLDFFLIWMHVVLSPKIYGLVVFKCRRIGDTEKALCMIYEYASRVRNTINGMQDCRKEDEIFKTYQRLTFAHDKMIWFMKPINRGTTNPKANLEFKMPETKMSVKGLQKQNSANANVGATEFEFDAIGSEINYYVSTPDATDGKRHGRLYVDEFGKPKRLNPLEGWKYAKKSLVDEIFETLSGKSLYTSTVEEEEGIKGTDESKYLAIAQEVWDQADPNNVNESGETTSGMIRVVRGALERGLPDRWGFADKERLRLKIESEKKHLINQRKWKDLVTYSRQNCVDIQDIFTSMSADSNFNTENLVQREFRLQHEIKPAKWVRGNLEWVDKKFGGDVYFDPTPNGRWVISGHPRDFGCVANAKDEYAQNAKPRNIHAFCMAIDPVAQKDVLEKTPSLAGLAVKVKLNPLVDGDKFDAEGNPEYGGEHFVTNRYVCTYLYRHQEPTDNYEDWLKTMIYYGTDFLIEKNHSAGFQTYLELYKFQGYYMDATSTIRNHKGQTEQWGISANEKTIELYFSLLATLTNKWHNTIDHPDIITQLKSMNYQNRGKKDLGVAVGICEVAAQRDIKTPVDRTKENAIHFEEHIV